MELGLTNLHVLVTGASGGIGLEICRLFLEQGAKVTAQYNTNHSPLQSLISQYGSSNRIQTIQADLSQESEVIENLFDRSTANFGDVHILVLNHAAIPVPDEPIWEMPLERWRKTIDTNVTGSFIVAKEYVRRLRDASVDVKDNASVIIIGSTAGKHGEAGHADYAASKSALMYGFTLSLKNEIVKIAPKGRVNSIGPGWVKTPNKVEEILGNPKSFYRAVATTPLKKIATPHDIAAQTVILSSQKVSGHISGQVLMIEGGMEGKPIDCSILRDIVIEQSIQGGSSTYQRIFNFIKPSNVEIISTTSSRSPEFKVQGKWRAVFGEYEESTSKLKDVS